MFRSLPRLSTLLAHNTSAQQPVPYPYFVARSTRGNLPVYSDIRNAGSRYLILIRNVDGNAKALIQDLKDSLFEKDSPEYERMKIEIRRGKTLVITGGPWRNVIIEWLRAKGF